MSLFKNFLGKLKSISHKTNKIRLVVVLLIVAIIVLLAVMVWRPLFLWMVFASLTSEISTHTNFNVWIVRAISIPLSFLVCFVLRNFFSLKKKNRNKAIGVIAISLFLFFLLMFISGWIKTELSQFIVLLFVVVLFFIFLPKKENKNIPCRYHDTLIATPKAKGKTEYCDKCGLPLIAELIPSGFDSVSGKPIFRKKMRCTHIGCERACWDSFGGHKDGFWNSTCTRCGYWFPF